MLTVMGGADLVSQSLSYFTALTMTSAALLGLYCPVPGRGGGGRSTASR